MRNRIIISSILGLLLLFIPLGIITVLTSKMPDYDSHFSRTIQTQDGRIIKSGELTEPSAPSSVLRFGIDENGTYDLSLSMLPHGKSMEKAMHSENEPGFVTLCLWKDEQGNLLSSDCGSIFSTNKRLTLTKGSYEIDFYDISDEDTYLSNAKEYLCGSAFAQSYADIIEFDSLPKTGSWEVDYSFKVQSVSPLSLLLRISLLVIVILISILLIVLMLAISTKGESVKERYDERQQLEKGRAFRYAFLTTLAYLLLIANLQAFDLSIPSDPSVLYATGGLLGIAVYAVYCIWHESYFALNQRRTTLMLCFVFIGLINLLIGIGNIINGSAYQNGIITFHAMNLVCAVLFFVLFAAMLLKTLVNKRAKPDEEDDEEEE